MTDYEKTKHTEDERTLLELLGTAHDGTAETESRDNQAPQPASLEASSQEVAEERQNRELLGLLGYGPEPVTPAPELKAKVFAAIQQPADVHGVPKQDAPVTPVAPMPAAQPLSEHPRFTRRRRGERQPATGTVRSGRRFRSLLAAAVVAFLMVGMAGWFYVQLNQQQSIVEQLQAELVRTNLRLEELTTGRQDVLAALRGMALLPEDPIEVCQLRPTGDTPSQPLAKGKLVLAKANNRWWMAVRDLEPVEDDQIYVLWFLYEGQAVKRVNLGRGEREVEVNASGVPEFMTAAAITVESSLDASQPSGPRVLYGHSREMDRL